MHVSKRLPTPFDYRINLTVLIFFVAALLMVLVALAFVVVPLVRTDAAAKPVSDAGSNIAIYKSQRRELDEELDRGTISESEHQEALVELSARLIDDVPEPAASSTGGAFASSRPWWLVAVIALAVPLGATSLYATLGTPKAIEISGLPVAGASSGATAPNAPAASGQEPPMSDKQILAMVDTLAQKMQQNPGDPKGWILLARSQNALGRFTEAAAAFERAAALTPNDGQLLADYADAAVMAQQGRFEGKPYALIKQSLKIDPNGMKALALAGTAELRMGNRAASLVHWEKLKTLVAKDSNDYREVESIIAEVTASKVDVIPPPPLSVAPPSLPTSPGTSVAAAINSPAKPGVKVTGKVALAADVAGKLASGDTLFVFARAKEGPRMPLAVMRVPAPTAGAFPVTFELTDAMAMAPGLMLSSFAEVVIEARISKSGNAQLQAGDLSGVSGVVKPGATGITVMIGKVAP